MMAYWKTGTTSSGIVPSVGTAGITSTYYWKKISISCR
jgi:hypothetical protein